MTRVDIWRGSLADLDPPMDGLDPHTRRRADELVVPLARERFLAGRAIVRSVLSTVTGIEADSLPVTYLPSGRPVVVDGPSFSVSHSGSLILVAVAPSCPDAAGVDERVEIGVDVEQVRNVVGWCGAARRLPDQQLAARLVGLPPRRGCAAFLRAWVRYEAGVKACDGSVAQRTPVARDLDLPVVALRPRPGYVGALALRATGPVTVRYRDLDPSRLWRPRHDRAAA